MATVTISLPDALLEFAASQAATNGYGNAGEYLLGLLREAQAKQHAARLEALMLAGLASDNLPFDAAFRQRLNTKVERILGEHRDRAPS